MNIRDFPCSASPNYSFQYKPECHYTEFAKQKAENFCAISSQIKKNVKVFVVLQQLPYAKFADKNQKVLLKREGNYVF